MKKTFLRWYLLLLAIIFAADAQPPRLRNMGNTCYINSIIQCMYNVDYITNFLLFAHRIAPYKPESLASFYAKLVYAINGLPPHNSPGYAQAEQKLWDNQLTNFVNAAWSSMGAQWSQEDATQFFGNLVTSLVEDDKRYIQQEHPLRKTMHIESTNTLHCPSIHFTRTAKAVDLYLNIPASKPSSTGLQLLNTLEECLSEYFVQETLSDPDNYYKLDLTESQLKQRPDLRAYQNKTIPNCQKKFEIAALSDVVIIMPNRFAFDPATFEQRKLDHNIAVPLTMSFRKYYSASAQTKNLYKYDLIAAAQHQGGIGGGHYVAHIKDKKSGQWYYCSDATIYAETLEAATRGINQGYVFVYRKNEKLPDLPPKKTTKISSYRRRAKVGGVEQKKLV